jgi:hypothetical protein
LTIFRWIEAGTAAFVRKALPRVRPVGAVCVAELI